jgi:hypothetical protein
MMILVYDKQDQQRKAAFNERNPHMTQQQEPVARSPGGPKQKQDRAEVLNKNCTSSFYGEVLTGFVTDRRQISDRNTVTGAAKSMYNIFPFTQKSLQNLFVF